MNIEYFRTLFDYNRTLYLKVWESIMQLSGEQFVQEVGYSRGSIRDQMLHVANAQGGWLRGLKGLPDARTYRLDAEDYPTMQNVHDVWLENDDEMVTYLASLTDEQLDNVPLGMRGPVWQVLAHLINHGTDHRAQILRLLHDFGAPTFDQDLIYYLWRR